MLKYISYFFFAFILCGMSSISWSQGTTTIELLDSNTNSYPIIHGKIHVRDPAGIDSSIVSISENDIKRKMITFNEVDQIDSISKGKCVLILFENHKYRPKQREFFKELIRNSANDIVDADDDYYFASFDWDREEIGDNMLFFGSKQATNSADKLIEYSDETEAKSGKYQKNRNTLLYRSIVEGIAFLSEITTDKPKAIIILSSQFRPNKNQNYNEEPTEVEVIVEAVKKDIPLYAIGYNRGMANKYNFNKLVKDTYGLSHKLEDNDLGEAKKKLIDFTSQIREREQGKYYHFSYETEYPKDGKSHAVKIKIDEKNSEVRSFQTPSPTFSDWLKENIAISILIVFAFLIILLLIFFLLRKNKKEKQQKEEEYANRVATVESENKEAQAKIKKQEETQRLAEERNRIQQENELERQYTAGAKKKEEELIALMKQLGFPALVGEFQGQKAEFLIDNPLITLGRNSSNYYTVGHPTVSDSHAEIRFISGTYMIKDLGSSNGTIVNGEKIEMAGLNHGDIIQIGEITLTFLK